MIDEEAEDRLFAFAQAATPEEMRRRVDRLRAEVKERMRERIAELRGDSHARPSPDEMPA